MAKKAMILKEERRQQAAEKGKFPKVKLHNRCSLCGRPRSYYRFFGTCRICLRNLASKGELPGVRKSSW